MEAFERISHMFSVLALFPCFFGHYFHELLASGSHVPLCVATVNGSFWTNFLRFPRESGLRVSGAVRTWKSWNYFFEQYLAVTACVSTETLGIFSSFFLREGGLGCPGAVRTMKIWTQFQ